MKSNNYNDFFKEVDKVFKEVDKVFKQVEQIRETVQASPGPPGPWVRWFAWYPVKVHGKRKWLKNVFRREKYERYGDHRIFEPPIYEYGTVFDAIKDAGNH